MPDGERVERLLRGIAVLPEVSDRLEATGAPVDVICSVEKGRTVGDVVAFLSELGVALREPHTDYYVFATLRSVPAGTRGHDSPRLR
jgi:hypothetical protein